MTYTVNDIMQRYGVTQHTVLAWIASGELKALNVGVTRGKKKPRWRVTEQAINDFEALREKNSPPPAREQRRRKSNDVVKFYE